MQVKDVMSRDVVVVQPDTSVGEATALMRRLGEGPLPVCEGERLIGMVTDRDITSQDPVSGQDPHGACVQDVMSAEITFCFEEQDVREAERLMQHRDVDRLLVLNRTGQVVGTVSRAELAPGNGRQDGADGRI
jgi:CBS domain-containing protein